MRTGGIITELEFTVVVTRLLTLDRAGGPRLPYAREREVLQLMAEGHSNRANGERLYIGNKTVETHIGTIFFSKLELTPGHEVDRRVHAVLTYLRGT